MSLQDEILRATGGPTVNDGLASWFSKTKDESLQDAEYRWLGEQGAKLNTIQDRWHEFLGGSGHLNDLLLAYWEGVSP